MSTTAMHVAKTGLNAQQFKMQVIANNLANVNTTGFKRDRANFETLFYQVIKEAGARIRNIWILKNQKNLIPKNWNIFRDLKSDL